MLIQRTFELTANPYPHTATLAQTMTLPLVTPRDFASVAALPVGDVAILLNHSEHYRLLEGLLHTAWQQLETLQVLMSMQMPAGGRMPRAFLDQRVLMLQCVEDEESRWPTNSVPLLVIDNALPRYPLEAGDNRLTLRLYHPDENWANTCLDVCSQYLSAHQLAPLQDSSVSQGATA
ncbi:hypothetical protein CHH28_02870 [Bacterioplanes sanyensis]|uniref:Uncharacterized protein n=1 Tax=Bacterioplanes sanyensis TaxID=1249553 RepID=A0A222FF10_9GAMM|nr:hypothetical protein [Bacterioplanes sanyensis]ASP37675.1 hypothetical protein CHH28_02870 [Bacterioplanes sanyensis]